MPLVHWSHNLSVGIDTLDADHRDLVDHLNALIEVVEAGADRATRGDRLDRLRAATAAHFAPEEKAMREADYPEFQHHHDIHQALMAEIEQLRDEFASGGMDLGSETVDFVKSWLISHILESDKQLGGFLQGKADNENESR
jgi:hemerythrin